MSRIRSQLDTILAGNQFQDGASPISNPPRRVYNTVSVETPGAIQRDSYREPVQANARQYNPNYSDPAPQRQVRQTSQAEQWQENQAPGRDLANLQQSLDILAQRINALPKQAAPVQTAPAVDYRQVQTALASEIRNGYEQVRSELHASRPVADPDMGSDLKRIADGIARLQNSQNVHPDYVEQMQAELGNLNAGLSQLLNSPTSQIDLSGVTRSIETGYSDIVNKLDEVLSSRGSELPDLNLPDYTRQFDSLGHRLEEITRAMVSLTVSPNNSQDQLSFERIEARLASLAKSVDSIMENGSPANVSDFGDGGFGESIAAQLAQLSEKLENAGAMNEVGTHIFADVQGIAARLDNLQNEFGVLVTSLDRGPVSAGAPDNNDYGAYFAEIESRLADLANRFDAVADKSAGSPNTNSQEMLAILRELVDKVEGIEQVTYHSSPDDTNRRLFSGLEARIADMAAQLGNLGLQSGGVTDLSSITERLDHIEGQIASSRDIVIDIASQAAEQAARASASGVSGGQDNEPVLASILEELRHLRDHQAVSSQQIMPDQQLLTISETMAVIADRLAQLENTNAAAFSTMSQYAGQAQNETARYEHSQEYQEAAPYQRTYEAVERQHDDYQMVGERETANHQATAYQHVEEAPSLDMNYSQVQDEAAYGEPQFPEPEMRENMPEGEDIPLEPGSGMPDLEALVRRATQRKKTKAADTAQPVEEESSSTSELMAAARRAARMASQEASVMAEVPAKKPSLRKTLPGFKSPSFINKKMLMMSVAAIAIAVGGFAIVPKFLGSSKPAPVAEAPAVVEPSAAPASTSQDEAPKPEIAGTEPGTKSEMAAAGENADVAEDAPGDDNSMVAQTSAESPDTVASGPEADTLEVPAASASLERATSATIETPPSEIGNAALLAAVTSGDGNAIFEVARRFTEGEGVERNLEEAVKWYRIGAENNHVPSQYRLGNFYEKGHGLPADPAEAAVWYARAAAGGNALAMHNLAVLNAMGAASGEVDMTTAIGWFEKAANMGVKDSQVNLGILYTKGMGVDEDLEQAYKWFAVAAKGGDNDAGKKRDTVAQAMRPEQLEKARGEAELWKPVKIDPAANIAQVSEEWKSAATAKAATISDAEMIRRAQTLLAKAGFDPGTPDGQMGSKTRNAITSFQSKMGLPVDGRISMELLDALARVSI